MRRLALQPLPVSGRWTLSVLSWKRFRQALLRPFAGLWPDMLSARLAAGQQLRLHDGAGWTVACASGAVWITQEADARDIFLEGGEGFALDRGGLALVCACRDSMVAIRAPAHRGGASRREKAR
jgi:hypothetical protein